MTRARATLVSVEAAPITIASAAASDERFGAASITRAESRTNIEVT